MLNYPCQALAMPAIWSGISNFASKKDMLLSQFHKRFPDEAACEAYLKEVRTQQGVTCPVCGIGRCRDGIAAIHREVDKQFLQLYLNEFCWKFNRRFFRDSTDPRYDLFDRLVKISACYTSDIKWRNYDIPGDDEID